MKNKNFELIFTERQRYISILNCLMGYLKTANLNEQVKVIQKLIDLLYQEEMSEFVKLINGVDMWGGAGAVWEVYIENKSDANGFEKEMISLINLMERTNILGKGIEAIRKIFENNLKS